MELVTQERVSFGRDPVLLIGDPRHCQGLLRVHNPCDAKVKLRQLRFRTEATALASGCEGDAVVVNLPLALCPGETQLVRVKLRLPPGTPPGEYPAYLEGEGKSRVPVTIKVLESQRLRLSPAALELSAHPGDCVVVSTTASNLGNVPLTLPKRAVVELHAGDRGWLYHFHAAAGAHADDGYERFLNAFVRRIGRDEPPLGRARLVAGHGPLAPQDARTITLEVALPKRLRARRKYQAIVRLAEARLRLTLHVTSASTTISALG